MVTRERGPDGGFVTREEVRGAVRDGAAFDEEWRAAADARLPRGGGAIASDGWQQQQQQQQALPAPRGADRGAHGHRSHRGR